MKKTITSICIAVLGITNLYCQQLDSTFNFTGYHEYDVGTTGEEGLNQVVITDEGKILNAGAFGLPGSTFNNGKVALSKLNTDGSLDLSFNGSGFKIIDCGPGDHICSDMKLQNDGKIVMTVQVQDTTITRVSGYFNYLVRLHADGTFDTTFGSAGKVITDSLGINLSSPNLVFAIKDDGKIIVTQAVIIISPNIDVAVLQFNTDGTLDTSFGTSGRTVFGFYEGDAPHSIAIQSDDKIVIAGDAYNPAGMLPPNNTLTDIFVARLNSNGTIDSSFATNGIYTTTVGTENDRLDAVLIQPDGNILVSGAFQVGPLSANDFDLFTLRLLPNGTKDTTYGNAGFSLWRVSNIHTYERAHAMLLQNDGKIVIASSIHTGLQHVDFALTRFLSDGTLDSSFATNGSLITNMVMAEQPEDMVFQSDGKLVVSGLTAACNTCPLRNITYRFDNLNVISGLDPIQEANPIRIYPNPASNYFKIGFSGRISQVELYNVGGQQIIAAKNSKIIDVSGIASGLYFYKITNDEGKLYLGKLLVE